MHVLMFAIGILVTVVGAVMISFGIPIREFGLGNALISAGTSAAVGGLLLIGLAVVARHLGRIVETLDTRPIAWPSAEMEAPIKRPMPAPALEAAPAPMVAPAGATLAEVAPAVERAVEPAIEIVAPPSPQEPAPASPVFAAPSVAASSEQPSPKRSFLERFRRMKASPLAAQPASVAAPPPTPAAPAPAAVEAPPVVPAPAPVEAAPPPAPAAPVDLAPLTKVPDRGFDAVWSRAPSQTDRAAAARTAAAAPPRPAGASPAVFKSGVIDGMAYTLYTDGSIVAELPQGTLRFESIDALRAYLTGGG